MSKNLRLLWDNTDFDNAILTVEPVDAVNPAFPVQNVQDTIRQKVFKTSGTGHVTIKVDFGQDENGLDIHAYARAIAFISHNFNPSATFTVRAFSDEWNTLTFEKTANIWESLIVFGDGWFGDGWFGGYPDEKDLEYWPKISHLIFWDGETEDENISQRYWEIEINNGDAAENEFYLGRIFLCDFWEPKYNFAYGWQFQLEDPSHVDVSVGGVKWCDVREQFYKLKFSLKDMTKGEAYSDFIKIVKRIGVRKDAVLCLWPDDVDYKHFTTVYGRFTKVPAVKHANFVQYQSDIEFVESL